MVQSTQLKYSVGVPVELTLAIGEVLVRDLAGADVGERPLALFGPLSGGLFLVLDRYLVVMQDLAHLFVRYCSVSVKFRYFTVDFTL